MKIIAKVETNYFRSIYTLSLAECADLNVLVGGNDVGKSNILKALNLFFNNETELNNQFRFNEDLSRLREVEARNAKGRSTIWIRITFNNYENWRSLPNQIAVKKVWSRYFDQPEMIYPDTISPTVIARFLNKISFHYIPAVRGRDIFTRYLTLLHDALVDDERAGIAGASAGLIDRINQNTADMSTKIRERLGFDSNIGAPRDLRQLFTALDFSTRFNEDNIPLQKRGDGIQARHIPFILDFIAAHSTKNHIWAYEEPENSLEMGKVFDIADQFFTDFSRNKQIFLTTHSPAFYDLTGDRVKKWLVVSKSTDGEIAKHTFATPFIDTDETDVNIGVAALISKRAAEINRNLESAQKTNADLLRQLEEANLPQVVVEGITDKIIIDKAVALMFPGINPRFSVVPAQCATNVISYIRSIDAVIADLGHPVVGLVDNDNEGREAFKAFKARHIHENGLVRIVNHPRHIYCGILPIPEYVTEAQTLIRASHQTTKDIPVTIETLVAPECIARATQQNVLRFREATAAARSANLDMLVNLSQQLSEPLPENLRYLVYEIDDATKRPFAEWFAANATADDLGELTTLITQLSQVVGQ